MFTRAKSLIILITLIFTLIISGSYLFACRNKKNHSNYNYKKYHHWNNDEEDSSEEYKNTISPETTSTPEETEPSESDEPEESTEPSFDDSDIKTIIYKLTSIFENSTTELEYTYCEDIGDGRGLTFGFPGFCSGTYDGTMFLKEYQNLNSDNILVKYIERFEEIDDANNSGMNSDTSGLENFGSDLAKCIDDPYFIEAQHNVVNRLYWNPSQEAVTEIGAKNTITKGELYDSFINHGENGARDIIETVNSNLGGTPGSGVDESKWLEEFLDVRLNILQDDDTWSGAVDRVHVYQKLLEEGNINLNPPMNVTCYGDSFTIN
jgi:chitosanase